MAGNGTRSLGSSLALTSSWEGFPGDTRLGGWQRSSSLLGPSRENRQSWALSGLQGSVRRRGNRICLHVAASM